MCVRACIYTRLMTTHVKVDNGYNNLFSVLTVWDGDYERLLVLLFSQPSQHEKNTIYLVTVLRYELCFAMNINNEGTAAVQTLISGSVYLCF